MRRLLLRLAPVMHLTRVSSAFAAVANVWLVILWTRGLANERGTVALREEPLWLLLTGGTVAALGLFAFGASLNDILDLRRDRALRPDRPLPSGRINLDLAVPLVAGTLIAATLGATVFGTAAVVLTLAVAAAVLAFNALGKFIPAIGMVLLGLIYAGHMALPNVRLVFVWPVWLVMTHALVLAGLTHTLARKVPPLSRRAIATAVVGWLFWSGVIFAIGWHNSTWSAEGRMPGTIWPDWARPMSAVIPGLLAAGFVVLVWRKVSLVGRGPRAAEKIGRYGALWLALYACGWLLGQGLYEGAAIMGGLTVAGFLGMTVLREVYHAMEQPTGYRR
jgi:hypothetical protein